MKRAGAHPDVELSPPSKASKALGRSEPDNSERSLAAEDTENVHGNSKKECKGGQALLLLVDAALACNSQQGPAASRSSTGSASSAEGGGCGNHRDSRKREPAQSLHKSPAIQLELLRLVAQVKPFGYGRVKPGWEEVARQFNQRFQRFDAQSEARSWNWCRDVFTKAMTTWQNHGQDSSQLCGDMPAVEWNAVLHELSVYVKPKEGKTKETASTKPATEIAVVHSDATMRSEFCTNQTDNETATEVNALPSVAPEAFIGVKNANVLETEGSAVGKVDSSVTRPAQKSRSVTNETTISDVEHDTLCDSVSDSPNKSTADTALSASAAAYKGDAGQPSLLDSLSPIVTRELDGQKVSDAQGVNEAETRNGTGIKFPGSYLSSWRIGPAISAEQLAFEREKFEWFKKIEQERHDRETRESELRMRLTSEMHSSVISMVQGLFGVMSSAISHHTDSSAAPPASSGARS